MTRSMTAWAWMSIAVVLLGGCSFGSHADSSTAVSSTAKSVAATGSAAAISTASTPGTPTTSQSMPATPAAVTIGWVGDITPGSSYGMPPQHGQALFSHVRGKLKAPDIMIGNLEGTYGTGGASKGSSDASFSFQAPPDYAKALSWAGFDVMNVANNHAHDYLDAGMTATHRALKSAHVAYTGLPGQITVVERNGVRVAFIGAAPYPWSQSLADVSATARLVRRARTKADSSSCSCMQGPKVPTSNTRRKGAEHAYGEFRGSPRAFAHAMISAGASAVLGSGPHVVRGVERYKGGLIAYSWAISRGGATSTPLDSGPLGLLTIRIDSQGEVLGGQWTSLKLASSGASVVDSDGGSLTLVKKLSRQDFTSPWPIATDGKLAAGR